MKKSREQTEQKKKITKITQISPGEGLSEGLSKGLRGLMENSGDSGRDSARDSGENSGTQGTQTTHFGELREGLRRHLLSARTASFCRGELRTA